VLYSNKKVISFNQISFCYQYLNIFLSRETKEREKSKHTLCVKDCGLHNQNINVIILFACLVGWLESSPIEKNQDTVFKKLLGLMGLA